MAPPDMRHGRIGPNAIIQTALVVRERFGRPAEERLLRAAGLEAYVARLPDAMIDEHEAAQLFASLFATLPPSAATDAATEAGARTGAYILAHRIPKIAQTVLRVLPKRLAARLLLRAIARHAWTFAGSGRVSTTVAPHLTLSIAANPVAMPACLWHVAVLSRLFRDLVNPAATVRQTTCCAAGDAACRFVIDVSPAVPETPVAATYRQPSAA